ncbi:ATP-binding protein [Hydrogenophaga sp.]|uniref:ATP-binding protein n=1 Tax=Hydrogenophaga sp. TaxID=1904254 RepID=UPI0025BFFAAB|nr:ATP-binding protein [Hydrogenophaga sp.]
MAPKTPPDPATSALPVVCLLGGESTGKTALSLALAQCLQVDHGMAVRCVPETLRGWCETAGRAPLAHEQAAIATEQSRLVAAAAAEPGVQLVIADTSALMVAAYSELYFQDSSLVASARAEQSRYGLNLVMGLDLPWTPDGLFRDGPALRDATDALIRRELNGASLPYQTIYGRGEARLQQALRAVGSWLGRALVPEDLALTEGRVPWQCDNCSDPDCEHRLFTRLVGEPRA